MEEKGRLNTYFSKLTTLDYPNNKEPKTFDSSYFMNFN